MYHKTDYPLAPLTSFKTGGVANSAVLLDTVSDFEAALKQFNNGPYWWMGFGSNSLVSDAGLDGTTFIMRSGTIQKAGNILIADSGVWWDDLVQYAINEGLWGLELTSAIPGGVGAALVGNIAAYGQAVADTLEWAEICDSRDGTCQKVPATKLGLQYRRSELLQSNRSLVVLRAAFKLSPKPTKKLEYESALSVAHDQGYDVATLQGRRDTIIETRRLAGSLWDYRDATAARTAGSYFRNPLVSATVAEQIMNYDETGKSLELLKTMNRIHGGEVSRVSAAHILLAAGFARGQSWFEGAVRLHPQHVLKLENAQNATSEQINSVAQEIVQTVKTKLQVELEPEIRLLGTFNP